MYLTDAQLRARLDEFEFTDEDPALEFSSEQIGPCSIDLHLSLVYWTPKAKNLRGRRVVDLERSKLLELSPTRGWVRHQLQPGEKITIPPGGMVLGRVSEDFRMPSDCAGAIEGRSSFARLGLSVHAAGGFINPGWRGRMPLTLVNHSPVVLRIPVGIQVCQLMVIGLSQRVEKDYAERLDRKYYNDTGGPSQWWRDKQLQKLRASMESVHIQTRVYDELEELLVELDNEPMLERLENFVGEQKAVSYGSADELLTNFVKVERRTKIREDIATWAARAIWGVLVPIAIGAWTRNHPIWIAIMWTVAAALAVGVALIAFIRDRGSYLLPADLQKMQLDRTRRRTSNNREDGGPPESNST